MDTKFNMPDTAILKSSIFEKLMATAGRMQRGELHTVNKPTVAHRPETAVERVFTARIGKMRGKLIERFEEKTDVLRSYAEKKLNEKPNTESN